MPLRRFRYNAGHDILKRPKGHILRPGQPIKHGRFFCRKDGSTRPLWSAMTIPRCCWAAADVSARPMKTRGLCQRHRWRSEGFHGEAKTWHGLARAVRRGLANMKIQAYLTAAAVNLKRLAAALIALLWFRIAHRSRLSIHGSNRSVVLDVWGQAQFDAP